MEMHLKDLDLRSEALMEELAQDSKNGDTILGDVKLTKDQQLLGIPKSLVYIASLVIPPFRERGNDPPYTKEEERLFARLQILYQQQTKKHFPNQPPQQLPKLFKLSPKFFRVNDDDDDDNDDNDDDHETADEITKKVTEMTLSIQTKIQKIKEKVKHPSIACKMESKEDKNRRMKIMAELLAEEAAQSNNGTKSSKQQKKKNRKKKNRSMSHDNLSSPTTSSSTPPMDEEDEEETPASLAAIDTTTDADADASITTSMNQPDISPSLQKSTHHEEEIKKASPKEQEEDTMNNPHFAVAVDNRPAHSQETLFQPKANENLIQEAENDDSMSQFLKNMMITPSNKTTTQQPRKDLGNTTSNTIKSYLEVTARSQDNMYVASNSRNHGTTTKEEELLRKKVEALQTELSKVKEYYEGKLKECQKHLEESIRKERETSEERFQALQLRLYIADNRAQTLEDALNEHIAAVSHLPRRTPREGIGDSTL